MTLDECFNVYKDTDRIKRLSGGRGSLPIGFLKSFMESLCPKNIHGVRYFILYARMRTENKEEFNKIHSERFDEFKSWEEMRPHITSLNSLAFLDEFHADDWELYAE
jgi:hypothetical protein